MAPDAPNNDRMQQGSSYVPYQGGLVRCICPGDESEILPGILSGPAGLKGQMTSEQITSEQMASGQRSGEYNAWGRKASAHEIRSKRPVFPLS